MEVGGKPANHRTVNTLLFEDAVSHLRGAALAKLSRDRGGGWVGRLGQTERKKMIWQTRSGITATSVTLSLKSLPTAAGDNYCKAAGNMIELDTDMQPFCSLRCVFVCFT